MKKFFSATAEYLGRHHGETALLLCSLIYILLALSSVFYGQLSPSGTDAYVAAALIEIAVIALPSVIYFSIRSYFGQSDASAPNVGSVKIARDKIALIILSAFALIAVATAGGAIIARLGYSGSSGVLDVTIRDGADVGLRILAFALVPAISEEFLCRGILMGELRALGPARALIISSLAFAMLHFNAARFPIYLVCGFILGVIMLVTDSIAATALVHFIFNLFSLLAGGLITALTEQIGDLIILFFLSALLFIICLIFILRELAAIFARYAAHPEIAPHRFSPPERDYPSVSLFGAITPALGICVLLYIIFAIFI